MPKTPKKSRLRKAKSIKEVLANLEISDVSLWETSLTRNVEYLPALHDGKTVLQSYRSIELEESDVTIDGETEARPLLRALVTFGVRTVLTPDEKAKSSDDDPSVVHALTATFAIDLFVVDNDLAPTEEIFTEFVERNLPLLAWPFWRSHVYDTFKRASLPVPIVPLYGSLTHDEVDDG